MAAISGRKIRIKRGSTAVAGAKSDKIKINNEPIDITSKDSSGWRTLLADAGVRFVDADVEGIIIDSTFLALVVGTASALLEAYTLEVLGIGSFSGNFYLTGVEITGEHDGAAMFTASILSTGTITFA